MRILFNYLEWNAVGQSADITTMEDDNMTSHKHMVHGKTKKISPKMVENYGKGNGHGTVQGVIKISE